MLIYAGQSYHFVTFVEQLNCNCSMLRRIYILTLICMDTPQFCCKFATTIMEQLLLNAFRSRSEEIVRAEREVMVDNFKVSVFHMNN